jgi:hypothetical protein
LGNAAYPPPHKKIHKRGAIMRVTLVVACAAFVSGSAGAARKIVSPASSAAAGAPALFTNINSLHGLFLCLSLL